MSRYNDTDPDAGANENYENQTFACGSHALALQFHLEADPRQLEEWYVGHAVELATAGIAVTQLRARTAELSNVLEPQADGVFAGWPRQLGYDNAPVQPIAEAG